jgi:hypothetical protein
MSRNWYMIEDLIARASKIREADRGQLFREGRIVAFETRCDRVRVAFEPDDLDGNWRHTAQLDYWVDGKWVYGKDALTKSYDGKTIMYKIEAPDIPDFGWVIYPTFDEASSGLSDHLDTLAVDDPRTLIISVIEMTPEEFDALPEWDY